MSSITPQSNGVVTLIARIFLSILFILAGYGKLTAISGTAGYLLASAFRFQPLRLSLSAWWNLSAASQFCWLSDAHRSSHRWSVHHRRDACCSYGHSQGMNALMAQKNIAIAGGLFILALHGAGSLSIDAKRG